MKWTLQTVGAALIGALVTFVIGLGIWALAYFGDINLHLPIRPEYAQISNEIKNNLPPNYTYTIQDVSNFRNTGGTTLVVVANDYDVLSRRSPPNTGLNGILMLLDEDSAGNYLIGYRFEPEYATTTPPGKFVSYALALVNVVRYSAVQTLLTAQWVPQSNGSPPIFGAIIYDASGATKMLPIHSNYPGPKVNRVPDENWYYYGTFSARNQFSPDQTVNFDEYQLLGVEGGSTFEALYRTDNNCDGCRHRYAAVVYYFDPNYGLQRWKVVLHAFSDPINSSRIRILDAYQNF